MIIDFLVIVCFSVLVALHPHVNAPVDILVPRVRRDWVLQELDLEVFQKQVWIVINIIKIRDEVPKGREPHLGIPRGGIGDS